MYNPEQPRQPAGSSSGGEWVRGAGGGHAKKKNAEVARQYAASLGHIAEVYSNPKSSFAAAFSQGKIHINAANSVWTDPIGFMRDQTQFSSDVPEHIINHEIGHALFDPPDNWFGNFVEQQDMARRLVSKYSARNPKEFVSEVYAGMQAGKIYPPEIMNMFNRYAKPRR